VFPSKGLRGTLVWIAGSGFNAIGGLTSTPSDPNLPIESNCTSGIRGGNSCSGGLQGTCVEFEESPGRWNNRGEVLAVTPTHIVVRSPMDCQVPGRVKVRRRSITGGDVEKISDGPMFCFN